MKSAIDSNVVLRLILGDIPEHTSLAQELVDSSDELNLSEISLVEIEYALSSHYDYSRDEISNALRAISEHENFVFDKITLRKVLPMYIEHKKLSFADIYLSFWADVINREPLWTFDKKLASQMPNAKLLA